MERRIGIIDLIALGIIVLIGTRGKDWEFYENVAGRLQARVLLSQN